MKKILEVGCGLRPYLFKETEDEIIHLDKVEFPHVDILCDVENGIPFPSNTFDELIANHVFEHLTDTLKFLRECYRVLKDEGLVKIKVPINVVHESFDHRHVFTEKSFEGYLKEEITYYGTKWELNHQEVTKGELIVWLKKLKF